MSQRRFLSLTPIHPFGRSAVTCRYRCGDQCAHHPPNESGNAYFGDVLAGVVSRRGMLRAGAVLGVGAGLAALPGNSNTAAAAPAPRGLGFTPVAPNTRDVVVVPPGYRSDVLIRWGDAVLPQAPAFDFDRQQAAAQARQFGYNNDYCGLVALERGTWLMGSNHEYTTEPFMFYGYDAEHPTAEQVRIAWAAHGFSVVVVARNPRGGLRTVVDPYYNRRITATTPMQLTGPAAGSPQLRTAADPSGRRVLGTFANCSGGTTPWGTFMSGEENFHSYFANADRITDPAARRRARRYGLTEGASERKWERFDTRFDLAAEPHEANRFGWVVEIDPHDPHSVPRKHTALGRMKHEAATVTLAADGRAVVYMGDDEAFEYLYKFVSRRRFRPGNGAGARRHNLELLTDGTLYVAALAGDGGPGEIDGTGALPADGEFDGRGRWIPLATGNISHVPGFTADEVYVHTRLAADAVAPTAMDRPEDVQPSPRTGRVYAALTNNTARGTAGRPAVDEANPRNANKNGHVLEWAPDRGDPASTGFSWRLLLVCGDPRESGTYFAGYDKSQVSPISCPDNLAFDRDGTLWIATDGSTLGNDALHAVPLTGRERGHVQTFLTVPRGAETCGPVIERDFVLVSVQHPGQVDGASPEHPVSHWPDGGTEQPRPAVVAVRRG